MRHTIPFASVQRRAATSTSVDYSRCESTQLLVDIFTFTLEHSVSAIINIVLHRYPRIMIILKVKDVETDEDSLEMPEWMNNTHDIESDGSESSSDFNSDLLSDSSSDTSSDCSCNLEDAAKDLDELCNDEDQEDFDNSSDNAASSLSDDMDDEIDGLELFPAYHLPDNMDTSDDEETAMARGCWFWYLYDKGYVSFPTHTNRDTDSEDKSGMTESTSGTEEKSKILDDSKLFDPSTTDKADTAPDETKAEKSTHSIIKPLDT